MVMCDAPDLVRSESEGASNADLTRRIQRIINWYRDKREEYVKINEAPIKRKLGPERCQLRTSASGFLRNQDSHD
jgi:hypothetical protein